MAKYFAGNSLACFTRTNAGVVEATTAGRFDSAFVSSGISLPGSGAGILETSAFGPATGTLWLRFDLYITVGLNNTETQCEIKNGATGVFRLQGASGNLTGLTPQYWNGSAWVSGTAVTFPSSTLLTVAVKIVFGTSWEVFIGGVSQASGTMAGSPPSQATIVQFKAVGSSGAFVSQVMLADYDIRDSKYMPAAISGNSATNVSGTGTFTDVNETVLNDATAVALSVSGNKRGFTQSAITVPTGYVIGASVVSARGRATGTITDGKIGIRSTGTNFSSGALSFGTGYNPKQRIDELDPGTASPYTQSGFNAIETYVEAA